MSKNKGLINILLIIILVVLAGITGYLISDKNLLSIKKSDLGLNLGQTSNWLICLNEKYGYEIRYPSDWKIWKLNTPDPAESGCDQDLDAVEFSSDVYDEPSRGLTVHVQDVQSLLNTVYSGSKSVEDYLSKSSELSENWAVFKESILDGEKLSWLMSNGDLWLFTYHEGAFYSFRPDGIDDHTLNNFLDSFKFIR